MDLFEIAVHYGTNVLELGHYDVDHISIITLLHATYESHIVNNKVQIADYDIWVVLPWCSERIEVIRDNQLMGIFRMFSDYSCTRIIFEIDNKPYIPLPPMGSTCNPNAEPGQLVYGDDLGDNILNYLGDNENGVKVGDETSEDEESVGDEVERNDDEFIIGDGVERNEEGEDNEIVGDINEVDNNDNLQLFEGYQSKEDDEFISDSDTELPEAKIAKLVKGNPFKQMISGEIYFRVGQTHDSVYTLREILREYAIQEGISLNRVKNDKDRLTYTCKGDVYP
ncbi:hypothetical protein ACOSQ3_009658 [Xanthoceras sorbifolium]